VGSFPVIKDEHVPVIARAPNLLRLIGEHHLFAFVVLFSLATEVGEQAVFERQFFSIVQPACGILVCFLLAEPLRNWWRVGLLAALCTVALGVGFHAEGWPIALAIACARFAGAALATYLLKLLSSPGRGVIGIPFPLLGLALSCIVAGPALSAATSAWVLSLGNGFPMSWDRFGSLWAADAMGMIVSVPIFLVWRKEIEVPSESAFPQRSMTEWLGTFFVLGVGASLVFVSAKLERAPFEYPYLLFPVMGWIALRMGLKGAAAALTFVTALGIWATFTFPNAPFRYTNNVSKGLMALQMYLAALYVMSFSIASLFQQRILDASNLKRLSAKMTSALEQERKNIAYDIHDNVGQLLAALKMQITTLRDVRNNDQQKQIATSALQVLDKTLESLRAISHKLQASLLDQVGFETAVRYLVSDVEKASGIKINLSVSNLAQVKGNAGITLYRIIQEALSNAIQHSGTSIIDVALWSNLKRQSVSLSVRDYGAGPTSGSGFSGTGLGLVSMRERASAIGGTFEIKTTRHSGTAVEVVVPFSSLKGEENDH
jgi:signal transduction histidine kinase